MSRPLLPSPLFVTLLGFAASIVLVQSLAGQDRAKGGKNKRAEAQAPKVRPLPNDERLMALHRDFVKRAEGLAKEYENDKDWGKARSVYEEILKLVPQYKSAADRLAAMIDRERQAQSVVVNIRANDGWQDTGVDLIADKPVSIVAGGTWVFHLEIETNADGLSIPKELRDFNPGCLIGMIPEENPEDNKPFVIGPAKQFQAERSGRLFLRMYDTDPRDNSGSLKVEIRGTFKEGR
ncbi:MAG: hypothetical protein WD872_14145 [Pirellulaceae bacterium]